MKVQAGYACPGQSKATTHQVSGASSRSAAKNITKAPVWPRKDFLMPMIESQPSAPQCSHFLQNPALEDQKGYSIDGTFATMRKADCKPYQNVCAVEIFYFTRKLFGRALQLSFP